MTRASLALLGYLGVVPGSPDHPPDRPVDSNTLSRRWFSSLGCSVFGRSRQLSAEDRPVNGQPVAEHRPKAGRARCGHRPGTGCVPWLSGTRGGPGGPGTLGGGRKTEPIRPERRPGTDVRPHCSGLRWGTPPGHGPPRAGHRTRPTPRSGRLSGPGHRHRPRSRPWSRGPARPSLPPLSRPSATGQLVPEPPGLLDHLC